MKTETIIGVDLGGSRMTVALYDESWSLIASESAATEATRGFPDVFARTLALINKVKREDTAAIGFGIAGLVRKSDNVIHACPNIPGAENFALAESVREACRLPVLVQNDSRCFTLAEARMGAGKGHEIVVGITMGTGVGGGIAVGGHLLTGERGFGGEIGHMLLMPGAPPFSSKNKRGEIEQFLSGTAMGQRCAAAKRPEEYLEGEVCAFLRPEVLREVAWMVANLTHLLDPGVIVFGGSTGRALAPHLTDIAEETKEWVLPGTPLPLLKIAQRKDAGTLGAALLTQ